MFDGGHEIKSSTKHVEAGASVISGRGFNSRRLHSTRCARSWQAIRHEELRNLAYRLVCKNSESNALSER